LANPVTSWEFLVDWDNNGNYTGTYDDISSRVEITPGVTATRGRDPARSLGEPRIPAMQLVAMNDDRFFSNDFPGSPIYQKASTGRPIRWQWRGGTDRPIDSASVNIDSPSVYIDGTVVAPLFTGFVDNISHQASYQDRRVTMRSLGALIRLKDRPKITNNGVVTDITTGEAMDLLLDAVGWPADKRIISGTAVVLKHWWLDRADAYAEAVALYKTEGPGAALYEDEEGNIVFEGQLFRQTAARSLSVQANFQPDGTGIYFADPQHEDGAQDIINVASYAVVTRQISAVKQIWSYGQTLTLLSDETRTFEVYLSDPWFSTVSPLVSGTDYTLSSGSITTATALPSGSAKLTVTMDAGPSGAVLTGLQARGQTYETITRTEVENSVDTSSSQTTYGVHARDVSGKAEIDPNVAVSICDTTVQRYAEPRAVNHFAKVGYNDQVFAQILGRRISDRIHYREPQTGQDIDAFIESKEFRAVPGLITAIFGCERTQAPSGAGSYGRYDEAVYDVGVYGQ